MVIRNHRLVEVREDVAGTLVRAVAAEDAALL